MIISAAGRQFAAAPSISRRSASVNRESTQAAYYCYFLAKNKLRSHMEMDAFQQVMLSCLKRDSFYCKLNALKALAGIPHEKHLISPQAIEPIQLVKVANLGSVNPRLHSDEILIALAISAATDPLAKQALDCLGRLRECEAHSTVILTQADANTYAKLGLHLTCTPQYQTNKLFHG